MPTPRYQRVLLKISGEGFCREGASGIDHDALLSIAQQCRDVNRLGVELAIVMAAATSSAARCSPSAASAASPPTTWACSPP